MPETFQLDIFKLYLFPVAFNFKQSKLISFKSVSVLFIIDFTSVLARFAEGSSVWSVLRLDLLFDVSSVFDILFLFLFLISVESD